MKMKTDCKPKRFRKYQEREETHRTSRSRVATPDWSIDLKRSVRGKGSFTVERRSATSTQLELSSTPMIIFWPNKHRTRHTYNKSGKERVNPPHNQRLRYHHRHVPLHHSHHPFHRGRVRHRVRRRLPPTFRIFQESTILICGGKIGLTRRKGRRRNGVGIGAEVHTAEERTLFAEGGGVELFGSGGEEDGGVVAEDAGENLRKIFSEA